MLRARRLVLLTALAACGRGARPDASWDEARLSAALTDSSVDTRQRAALGAAARRSLMEVGR